jgi:hypothetical protein
LAQYYYTAAALPMLSFQQKPPISMEQFITFCLETLGPRDAAMLEKIRDADLTEPYEHPYAERWRAWEIGLRDALVVRRADMLGWGGDSQRVDIVPYESATIAEEATSRDTPLEAEELLDRARWDFIHEMEIGHYFDTVFLMCYCLKLSILERQAAFTLERGRNAYERIYETTLESLNVGVTDGQ